MNINWNCSDQSLLLNACLVGGEWVQADSGQTIGVENPATGSVIGLVPKMGAIETRRAICQCCAAGLAVEDRQRAVRHLATVV